MFKKIINWCTGGYNLDFYKRHKDEIQKSNSRLMAIGLMSIALCLISFIIASELTDKIHVHVISFTIMLGGILLLFFIHLVFAKNNALVTSIILGVFVVAFYTFLIIEETYLHSDRHAAIYYVFVIVIPITIIAPPYASFLVNLTSYIVFSLLSFIFKDISLFYLDAMFGFCCLIAGTFLGRRVVFNKFESFELSDMLKYQSRYDPLTNIYNRRAARKKLEEVLENENRLALAMIDIDDFKLYNDTYGHIKGDDVLRTIASILLYHVKKYGFFVSRYGGEEFLLVTYGSRVDQMQTILEDSANDMKLAKLVDENSKTGYVTFSAGYTKTTSCKDIEKLVETADKALYIAKNHGKNQIVFTESEE